MNLFISEKNKVFFFCFLFMLVFNSPALSHGVAINDVGAPPDSCAMLDVISIEKGLLIPRMTSTQRTTINNPAMGLIVFHTDIITNLVLQWDGLDTSYWASGHNRGTRTRVHKVISVSQAHKEMLALPVQPDLQVR